MEGVDLGALNRTVEASAACRVRPMSRTVIGSFKAAISGLPEVPAVYACAGDDDFLVHVALQDLAHLHAVLIDRLSARTAASAAPPTSPA
ncbi:Lrp/AsnC family transcriptional regulator [Saccharothrix australiensis]|uniref:Lrp/AsnC family transcriptional regulator n=1 Tax=Saccharothrix australiensis TaxID=2072 RepID=UPI001B869D01|nr:Lrp/AsnC ligand binding domain-containing protein [Saccharothrix australiensis]